VALQSDNDNWFRQDDFSTTVVCQDSDGSVLVRLAGDFDLSTAGDLRDCLVSPEVLDAERVRIDLAGVTFLDSSSIGLLVSAGKAVRSTGGTFSVRCPGGIALRVLQISGLVHYFEVDFVGGQETDWSEPSPAT
jgi:anti-sigma B factor antagonist